MKCPVCRQSQNDKNICSLCCDKTVDKDGNKVRFKNIDVFGGFKSIHIDKNNSQYEKQDHICYISGKKCYAEEARHGGIMIQLYNPHNPRHME